MGPGITIYRVDPDNGWKPSNGIVSKRDPEKEVNRRRFRESHLTTQEKPAAEVGPAATEQPDRVNSSQETCPEDGEPEGIPGINGQETCSEEEETAGLPGEEPGEPECPMAWEYEDPVMEGDRECLYCPSQDRLESLAEKERRLVLNEAKKLSRSLNVSMLQTGKRPLFGNGTAMKRAAFVAGQRRDRHMAKVWFEKSRKWQNEAVRLNLTEAQLR